MFGYTRPLVHAGFVALVVALLSATPPAAAAAKPGDLDPGFGAGGKLMTDFSGDFDEARAMAIQEDGRIVAAGFTVTTVAGQRVWDFAVTRYHPDGRLDPSFGASGKATVDFGKDFDIALAVTLQNDGKIVVGGLSRFRDNFPSTDFAVARLNPDGTPDASFGVGGKVTTDFAGDDDELFGVAVQADGKIVATGVVSGDAAIVDDFALVRYNKDGSLDRNFGSGGKVLTDFAGGGDGAFATVVQRDGKVIAVGVATNPGTGSDFALARYNANGTLDTSFGGDGKVTTNFGDGDEEADAVAVQSDGRIVIAGVAGVLDDEHGDFALARYDKNGELDTYFGDRGKVTTGFTPGLDNAFAVAVQRDGKIVAAGTADFALNDSGDFAVARYLGNGTLDGTFGTGGKVTTDVAGGSDVGAGMGIQRDGKIVVAGRATTKETTRDFGLARYLRS